MTKNTKQIRVLTEGKFEKLMDKISEQFKIKHGFFPSSDQICEAVARAVEDAKIFKD